MSVARLRRTAKCELAAAAHLTLGSAAARVGGTGDCESSTAELTLNGDRVGLAIAKIGQARAELCVVAQSCTLNPAAQHGPAFGLAVPDLIADPLRRPGQRYRQC